MVKKEPPLNGRPFLGKEHWIGGKRETIGEKKNLWSKKTLVKPSVQNKEPLLTEKNHRKKRITIGKKRNHYW